jgi:hypothetical protein
MNFTNVDFTIRSGKIVLETKNKMVIHRPISDNFVVINKFSKKIEPISTTKNGAIAYVKNKPLYEL